jgi:hypothetical protein
LYLASGFRDGSDDLTRHYAGPIPSSILRVAFPKR